MLRDITIGQYYPQESVIHRLDPRTKLFGTLVFIVSLFVNDSFAGYAYVLLFFALVVKKSRVPVSYMLKGLKPVIAVIIISVCLNLFMTDGHVLVQAGRLKITAEGIEKAVFYGIRIVYLMLGTSVMTLCTTPTSLTDGLEKALGFLKIIHIPVHDIAMMMSIALRFIPILTEELDKIMKAQMSRGADFESGGMIKKARNMVPLLVPLLISAFRRAGDLAMAMDARCYNSGANRTKLHPLKYRKNDRCAYAVLLAYLAGVFIMKWCLK